MTATTKTVIQNYALPLCIHGLSTYAITRLYRPSAHPVITALTLNALEWVHTWSQIQIDKLKISNQQLNNFLNYSIGLLFLLIQHRLSLRFPQELPSFFSAVAINLFSEQFAYFNLLLKSDSEEMRLPQEFKITSWTAIGMRVGLFGLYYYLMLRYLFKSPNSAINTVMAASLLAISQIVQSSLASYFDTTNENDAAKIQSMIKYYYLLANYHWLITAPAVHNLGQLFFKKQLLYFDFLGMLKIYNIVEIWMVATLKLGGIILSRYRESSQN